MPFLRIVVFIILLFTLLIAIFNPAVNNFYSDATLWATVLLVLLLFGMTFTHNIFLDFTVILMITFYVQRIIVLYFWPTEFDYIDGPFILKSSTVFNAVSFLVLCTTAIWIGYLFAQFVNWMYPRKIVERLDKIPFFGVNITFERFYSLLVKFLITFSVLRLVLILTTHIGISGVVVTKAMAIVFRVLNLFDLLWVVAIILLLKKNHSARNAKLAWLLIVLQVVLAFAMTSKGAIIFMLINLCIVVYYVKGFIPVKYVKYTMVLMILILLVYFPLTLILRSELLQSFTGKIAFSGSRLMERLSSNSLDKTLRSFSLRLSGFDPLLGFMSVGRNSFPSYISIKGDCIMLLNSLIPGDIVNTSNWISIRNLIPILLRGGYYKLSTINIWGAHGENMGIMGMAYIYFGMMLGPLFFFIWSLINTIVLRSRLNIIFKIVYFILAVPITFSGGYLVTLIKNYYETIFALLVVLALYIFNSTILYLTTIKPPLDAQKVVDS